MAEKMRALRLHADWEPKPDFKLGAKDIEGRQTYLGSRVWCNPQMQIEELDIPKSGPGEVLIKVKACGICGSDVHMAQSDDDNYIWYPGLTGFPCTLGHEMSGVVVEAGSNAYDKKTNQPLRGANGSALKRCSGADRVSRVRTDGPTTANVWMRSGSM